MLSDHFDGDWHRHQFGEGGRGGAAAGRGGNDMWRMPSQTSGRGASGGDGRTGGSAEGSRGGHWMNEGGRKVGGEGNVRTSMRAHPFPSSFELYGASGM